MAAHHHHVEGWQRRVRVLHRSIGKQVLISLIPIQVELNRSVTIDNNRFACPSHCHWLAIDAAMLSPNLISGSQFVVVVVVVVVVVDLLNGC